MFTSLKNKIKEETGSDVSAGAFTAPLRISNNNRMRSRFSSTISVNSQSEDGTAEQSQINLNDQLSTLRSQCNELTTKVTDLNGRLQAMQQEKLRLEKSNESLLETVNIAQTQKDIYCEEQEKIQNMQQAEIEKLKNLLSFREQEAVDRLAAQRQNQQQIENLTGELERLKKVETVVEDLQDELERLQHSSQLGKNNLTTTLAAVEEENRHLKMRLQIVSQARLEVINTLGTDEKIQALVHERKLLEQHLEEAHLQLSDIKSSWSGQNLALETQLSRLSKQVAEETTEKRKALKARDDMTEKVKALDFELIKIRDELNHRDNKIKLLEEEIDELNAALKECREESEQQILFERNKVSSLENDAKELKMRLQTADERLSDYAMESERTATTLRQQLSELHEELGETQIKFEHEREEKNTALLRNAEISQSEEILKKELRVERAEVNELHERIQLLEDSVSTKDQEVKSRNATLQDLQTAMSTQEEKLKKMEQTELELEEKNKTIKMLNQRLSDIKKTLQKELRNSKKSIDKNINSPAELMLDNGFVSSMVTKENSNSSCSCNQSLDVYTFAANPSGGFVMDEVNFKYLKHVIVKFLTSREVEARHLIRAVATLLKLNKEEEQLLHDTLNWKMSWFGSKPDHGTGQRAVSIPPS